MSAYNICLSDRFQVCDGASSLRAFQSKSISKVKSRSIFVWTEITLIMETFLTAAEKTVNRT